MDKIIRKAVFPVGGMGTRFLPATRAMPKEMLPIVDKPLIQYAVEEAAAAGITEFIFVTGRGKSTIEDHFDYRDGEKSLPPGSIMYMRQQEPLGLGHAIWCARYAIDHEPFAVVLADEFMFGLQPCLKGMMGLHREHPHSNIVVIDQVPSQHVERYGIIQPLGEFTAAGTCQIEKIVEKPVQGKAPSTFAVVGRYILNPEVLGILENQQPGANGEIQLTDALQQLMASQTLYGYRYPGQRYDCGSKAGYVAATLHMALGRDDLEAELGDHLMKLGLPAKALKMAHS